MVKKPLRVWSADRSKRYGIVAYNYEDLIIKAVSKLDISETDNIKIVLEDDGTVVDEDFWESLSDHTRLIILESEESWEPPYYIPQKTDIMLDLTDGKIDEKILAEKHLFNLQKNPAMMVFLSLSDMEMIRDVNLDELDSELLDKDLAKQLQDQCNQYYVIKKKDEEAVEFIDMLKNK